MLKKNDAANQWSYYQRKSTKQNLAWLAESLAESLAASPELKAKYVADIKRYKEEKEGIERDAENLRHSRWRRTRSQRPRRIQR